jgi:hypothetical protein
VARFKLRCRLPALLLPSSLRWWSDRRSQRDSWSAFSLPMLALLLGLTVIATAGDFDTPEDAVRTLEQAYIQKNADAAVAALDFVEGGRQLLQETNPALAYDPDTIKQTAAVLENSFRNELRSNGFPEFGGLKCSFVGETQIAPGLIKLAEQCISPAGAKSVQDLIIKKRDLGWRVVFMSPVF